MVVYSSARVKRLGGKKVGKKNFLIVLPLFFNQQNSTPYSPPPSRSAMLAPRSLAGRRAGCVGRGFARRGTARSANPVASSSSSPLPSQSSSAATAKKAKALPSLCLFPLSFSLARARLACSSRLVACGRSSSDSRDVSVAATSAAAADGGGSGTASSPSSSSSAASSAPTTSDAKTQPPPSSPPPPQLSAGLKPFHLVAFVAVLGAGLAFLAVLLYFTAGIQFNLARDKVVKRLLKTVALRQVKERRGGVFFLFFKERGREKKKKKKKKNKDEKRENGVEENKNSGSNLSRKQTNKTTLLLQVLAIAAAMSFVRFGLEPLCKALRTAFNAQGPWVSFLSIFFSFFPERLKNSRSPFLSLSPPPLSFSPF